MAAVHLVTGVAGFIGSHLAEGLIERGETVRGVDCFTPYYDQAVKRDNIANLLGHERFQLVEADLRDADLARLLDDVVYVYHFAAQPGVPASWAVGFPEYLSCNVAGTQRLLEAADRTGMNRLIFASSASTYGSTPGDSLTEASLPRPHSPYAVTKLTAEHLCTLYAEERGVPSVSLRLSYVYGPRQRPDVAIYQMIESGLNGRTFPLYGDGGQVRDFIFVDDVVSATIEAARCPHLLPGTTLNISTGTAISLNEMTEMVGSALGAPLAVERLPSPAGYVRGASVANGLARQLLAWAPRTSVPSGIARQVAWHQHRASRSAGREATRT
jgi:UDP-glucuronate 4-epimerase